MPYYVIDKSGTEPLQIYWIGATTECYCTGCLRARNQVFYFVAFDLLPLGYDDLPTAVTTECSAGNLTIHLFTTLLPTFDHTNFHLNNKTCKGNQFNDTHIILNTKLTECGTVKQTYNDSVIYFNSVQGYYKESRHSKIIPAKVAVKCEALKHFSPVNGSKSASIAKTLRKSRPSVNVSSQLSVTTEVHLSGQPTVNTSLRTELNLSVKPTIIATPISVKIQEKSYLISKEETSERLQKATQPLAHRETGKTLSPVLLVN